MALGNNDRRYIYVNVNEGKFIVGKGDDTHAYDTVDGTLEEITHYWKAVKSRPGEEKHCLRITIGDREEPYAYSIEAGMDTQFGRMFAGYVKGDGASGLVAGQWIKIRIQGNDQTKGASCFVDVHDGATFQKAPYVSTKENGIAVQWIEGAESLYKKYVPKEKPGDEGSRPLGMLPEEAAFIRTISAANWPILVINRPAYQAWFAKILRKETWQPSDNDPGNWAYIEDCAKKCIAAGILPPELRDVAVAAYDPLKDEASAPPPQAPAQTPAQTPTPVQTSAPAQIPAPVQTSAPAQIPAPVQTSVAAPGSPLNGFDPGGWKQINYVVPNLPLADEMLKPAADAHRQAVRNALTGKIPKGCRGDVVRKFLLGLGIPASAHETVGCYRMARDFAVHGTEAQLKTMLVGAIEDPFEDE